MKERFNPKSIAKTALAASLPIAAGLSACGDGATQSGMPTRLETPTRAPMAPVSPTPEPGRTTITLEVNCPPTDPNTPESYEKLTKEIIQQYGGAVVVVTKGLTCEKNNAPYVPLTFMRLDISANSSPYDTANLNVFGYADGSDVVSIFPATACDGKFALGVRSAQNVFNGILVQNEKTGKLAPTFELYEDCTTTIILEPDIPKTLN